MNKLVMLFLCLALTSGCGRGWFPRLFRGAPCVGGCPMGVPASLPSGNCGNCPGAGIGAGYESYGDIGGEVYRDQIIGSGYAGEQTVDGRIVGGIDYNGTYSGGPITSPSTMAPLTPAAPAR